jgi:hypothetical protein
MTKQILAVALLCIGAAFVLATPAHADIVATTASYDSPNGYDFATTLPPTTPQLIGTFNFTIPAGQQVGAITISGSFGNGDVPNTALSDYYLGFAGNEAAVQVAACDSIAANCYSGQEGPYAWTATLTKSQIAALAPALSAGSLDLTYIWGNSPAIPDIFSPTDDDDQYVYAGPATLDIALAPEPGTLLLCFTGLIGLAAFRRFRKPLAGFKSPI